MWRVAQVTRQAVPMQALRDFKDRIRRYEEVYETITDRSLHYIKLIDMYVSLRPCCPALSDAA